MRRLYLLLTVQLLAGLAFAQPSVPAGGVVNGASFAKGQPVSPTFRDALETQKVCDAVLASAKSGAWTSVA